MITERALINALILAVTAIAAPFMISSALESGDFVPFAIFAGLILILLSFFVLKDSLCLMPLLGNSMAITLNFLPLPLTAYHVFCIMLILYYVTGYVIIRQKPIKLGPAEFFWPSITIIIILVFHNHEISMLRVSGAGDTEGSKDAFLIYLAYLAYFCGINVKTPSVEFFSKIPLYTVILTAISIIPFALSTVVPGLAPYLHLITNRVNVDAYVSSQAGSGGSDSEGSIGRVAVFGVLGLPLQALLVCRYPIGTWIRPNRWWIIGVSLVCCALCVLSGFRNTLFTYIVEIMVATFCYYSWRSIIVPIVIAFVLLAFVVLASDNIFPVPLNKLPMIAQRTMSFLPGDWDTDAVESAKRSNDFRKNIQDVYIKEYIDRSPLIGIGYNINTKVFNEWQEESRSPHRGEDPSYIQAKVFIESQAYHTGWIILYDTVGIVGFASFLILAFSEIGVVAVFIFGPRADRRSTLYPLYVWLFTNLVTLTVSFFAVFGDFMGAFCSYILMAVALSHLKDLQRSREAPATSSGSKGQSEFSRTSEARYGYQSRY